jgi:hypothetical protein
MPIKRNIHKFLVLLVASFFFCQNCATIISGTSKEIPVTSNPVGARIKVDEEYRGDTPLILELKKNKNHIIHIEKQGYQPLEIRIKRKISGSLALSIIGNSFVTGSLCGLAVFIVGGGNSKFFIPGVGPLFSTPEEREKANSLETPTEIGIFLGLAAGILFDTASGANFSLSPANLDVTLKKIEGQPHLETIVMDSEQFQNIKWIRIKLSDSGRGEEILNKDFID